MTTATAAAAIMTDLAEVFAPLDARVEAESIVWGEGRREALKAWEASNTVKSFNGSWAYYGEAFKIAGGKTWYNVFHYASADAVRAFMVKNSAAVAARRNASIARKLEKAGVTEVIETTFTHSNDGFNGHFVVETNAGRKTVNIDTIYAGGYNVQCLHLRVLVKVK